MNHSGSSLRALLLLSLGALLLCVSPAPAQAQSWRGLLGQGWTYMEAGNFRKAEESFKAAYETPDGKNAAEVYYAIAALWWERRNAMASYMWLTDADKASRASLTWDGGPDGEWDRRLQQRRQYIERNFSAIRLRSPARGAPLPPLADPPPADPLLREFTDNLATVVAEGVEEKVAVQWVLLPTGNYWVGDDLVALEGNEMDPSKAGAWELVKDSGKARKGYEARLAAIANGESPAAEAQEALAAAEAQRAADEAAEAEAERARLAAEKAEQERLAKAEKAEQERLAKAEKAEQERLAKAEKAKAEQERIAAAEQAAAEQASAEQAAAEKAERERLASAERASAERAAAAEKAERERLAAVEKAERERLAAAEKAAAEKAAAEKRERERVAAAERESAEARADREAAEAAELAEAERLAAEKARRVAAEKAAADEARAAELARQEKERKDKEWREAQARMQAEQAREQESEATRRAQLREQRQASSSVGGDDEFARRRLSLSGGGGGSTVTRMQSGGGNTVGVDWVSNLRIDYVIPLKTATVALPVGVSWANLPVNGCSNAQTRANSLALHVGPRIAAPIRGRLWFAGQIAAHIGGGASFPTADAMARCASASVADPGQGVGYGVRVQSDLGSARLSLADVGWTRWAMLVGPDLDVGVLGAPGQGKTYLGVAFFVRYDQVIPIIRGTTYHFRPEEDPSSSGLGSTTLETLSGQASMARFQFGLRGRLLF